jgi:demethylmenaquinone methyltransferase/2-methoxy-6-polyprenyl-1,4-benzoquinol methylase
MKLKEIVASFDKMSNIYDLVSYTMSFGVTIYWRKQLIRHSLNVYHTIKNQNQDKKIYLLDLCSGTGDIAISLNKKINKNDIILALDISFGMLKKLIIKYKKFGYTNIIPIIADISKLPLKDGAISLATMSFGARSLYEGEKPFEVYLKEILRTCEYYVNLETSQPYNPFIKLLYYLYLYFIIIILGSLFFRHYNREYFKTIMRFPDAKKFQEILLNVGFRKVKYYNLMFGMACIHISKK